jgi:hypothetical protein
VDGGGDPARLHGVLVGDAFTALVGGGVLTDTETAVDGLAATLSSRPWAAPAPPRSSAA